MMGKNLVAEFLGTFVLVLGGVGAAVFTAGFPDTGVGILGVSLAFGLTVLCMAYAVGHISGGHFNPAVSLGLWAAGRFEGGGLVPYILAQIAGGVAGAGAVFLIAGGQAGGGSAALRLAGASNGFGLHSPGRYGLTAVMTAEAIATFVFLIIIIGATSKKAAPGFAGMAIGLALTLIHIVTIPISNTSVNPARSIAAAVFAGGGWPLNQLWVFIVFPIVGALVAGLLYRVALED
jgi:aquaporin Z